VLERRLLKAYAALYQQQVASIWHPPTRRAQAVRLLGGQLAPTQVRYAEQRLSQVMPELIQRLPPDLQAPLVALLLCEAPDLAAVVAHLVSLERHLNYREDDPRLKLSDHGTNRLARQQYGRRPLGEPLVLTPWVPVPGKPARLRTHRRARAARRAAVGQLSLWP